MVEGQGAVFQSFHGTGEKQGCHTMPCQLVLGHRFPHQLAPSEGRSFNTHYLTRTIELFARCTWSPKIVNPIDQQLDWNPEAGFVRMYLKAVQHVLCGADPSESYRELTWQKQRVLNDLRESVRDEPLTTYDAMLLMEALDANSHVSPSEVDRLVSDAPYIEKLQDQREEIIEIYAAREKIIPSGITTGEIKNRVNSEIWIAENAA
jgi:hypothetical protein